MDLKQCALCALPADQARLGPLLGPVGNTEYFIHRPCAIWSPDVSESDTGVLRNVLQEIRRGRQLKCTHCSKRGANIGCRVHSCSGTYHILCALEAGCSMFANHLVACPAHAKRFKKDPLHPAPLGHAAVSLVPVPNSAMRGQQQQQAEAPNSTVPLDKNGLAFAADLTPAQRLTAAARKRRRVQDAEQRLANADAVLRHAQQFRRIKDAESSDDEEHFSKKESARLARDIAKLNPITLTGNGEALQHVYLKPAHKIKGIIPPPHVTAAHDTAAVTSIQSVDFSSLGGLDSVVKQLTEMVLLPLLYPEMFSSMGVSPPRGILFYGPPGTGKTMAARALAGACAKRSPVPVTFFARKGADCLGKFMGEAERTLRLLFQEAQNRAPAIIFLDELDALVPPRVNRSGGADQIYASVVSTLLALMDGISDRGNVVVIGATNRPESIDPGLRRPGRFDREVYFSLPDANQRKEIVKIHTKQWPTEPEAKIIDKVVLATEGFAGADLKALAASAVLAAVQRTVPDLMAGMDDDDGNHEKLELNDALLERVQVEAGDWDKALATAPPPCSMREGLAAVSASYNSPIPCYLAPIVINDVKSVLEVLGASGLLLPEPATLACRSVGGDASNNDALMGILREFGAVSTTYIDDGNSSLGQQSPILIKTPAIVSKSSNTTSRPPCRLLLSGALQSGQERVTSTILRLLQGCPIHTASLPTLVAMGAGSVSSGCVSLVGEALKRAGTDRPCVLFLPRIEGWAYITTTVELDNDADADADDGNTTISEAFKTPGKKQKKNNAAGSGAKFPAIPSPFGGLVPLSRRDALTPAASALPTHNDEDDSTQVVQVTVVTEAWSVFESLVRQAPATQPLIVLATCHEDITVVPETIVKFFSPTSISSANGLLPGIEKGLQHGGLLKMTSVGSEQIDQAIQMAGKYVTSVVAQEAADQLENLLHSASSSLPSRAAVASDSGVETTTEPLISVDEASAIKPTTASEGLKQGLQVYGRVMNFIIQLGRTLYHDRRTREAAARRRGRGQANRLISMQQVAYKAAMGEYYSIDEFRLDAKKTAEAIIKAEKDPRRKESHTGVAALTAKLLDEIEAHCAAQWKILGFGFVETVRVFELAARHVEEIRKQQTKALEEAWQEEQDKQQRLIEQMNNQDEKAVDVDAEEAVDAKGEEEQMPLSVVEEEQVQLEEEEAEPMQVDDGSSERRRQELIGAFRDSIKAQLGSHILLALKTSKVMQQAMTAPLFEEAVQVATTTAVDAGRSVLKQQADELGADMIEALGDGRLVNVYVDALKRAM